MTSDIFGLYLPTKTNISVIIIPSLFKNDNYLKGWIVQSLLD